MYTLHKIYPFRRAREW